MILGEIIKVDQQNGLSILIDGEDVPTIKKYKYIASYVPRTGDRVIIEVISGTYVILGNIIDEYANSGISRVATTAGTAGRATNADNATKATTATSAEKLNGKTESQLVVDSAGKVRSGGTGSAITFTHAYNQLTVTAGGNSFTLKP
ncbi:hypothetical protein [Anaerorhabdus sp.]|uniref:hypothetical protein n=1 Tax=Anaerorhabdus sp. TaxID=1872524 RepID=UPI002B20DC91|nr:hypothetical protein [Anaerorhabdus sp.]MEA4876031.1 hypothetical protein [Anaerorhabdus sp.]